MNDSKAKLTAILMHKLLRQAGPLDHPTIVDRLGIDDRTFRAALKYSRTSVDRDQLANEIVCVTTSNPFLYFLAKTEAQSGQYISHRAKIADGHLSSVEYLLRKELDKFPAIEREIKQALVTVGRLREDIVPLLTHGQ